MKTFDSRLIRMIAVFKLLRVSLLMAVGVGALKLILKDIATVLQHWVTMLGLDPGNQYVDRALEKAAKLSPNKIRGLGIVSFIYAGLFLTRVSRDWLVNGWPDGVTVMVASALVTVADCDIACHAS